MAENTTHQFVTAARAAILIAASPMLLVAGCGPIATIENYELILESWVGNQEVTLIREWGPPASVHEASGFRFLTYISEHQEHVSGSSPTYKTTCTQYGIFEKCESNPIGGSDPYTVTTRCTTTFELQDGIVLRWQHKGNNCKALPPDNG